MCRKDNKNDDIRRCRLMLRGTGNHLLKKNAFNWMAPEADDDYDDDYDASNDYDDYYDYYYGNAQTYHTVDSN